MLYFCDSYKQNQPIGMLNIEIKKNWYQIKTYVDGVIVLFAEKSLSLDCVEVQSRNWLSMSACGLPSGDML